MRGQTGLAPFFRLCDEVRVMLPSVWLALFRPTLYPVLNYQAVEKVTSNKIVASLLVTLGVGLMGLALLAGRSSLARWSMVPGAVVAIILGTRGLRKGTSPVCPRISIVERGW
jgi:hypothetical protein